MEEVKTRLQQLRLRKLECQRRLRVLQQKLATNPRDRWTKRELTEVEELLAELEAEEQRYLREIKPKGGREP